MKLNRGKNDCCDSFMSFNTDGSMVCNECHNEWLPPIRGNKGRKTRLKGLVRLTLLRNRHNGPMTSMQIAEYIKDMKYRTSPTLYQISNYCSSDPHIMKIENKSGAEWRIIFKDL